MDLINWMEMLPRGTLFLSLMLLLGLPLGASIVARPVLAAWHGEHHAALWARLRTWIALAGLVFALSAIGLFLVQIRPLELEFRSAAQAWRFVSTARVGQMMLVRVLIGGLALVCAGLRSRPLQTTLLIILAVLGEASLSYTSHASAKAPASIWVLADFAHLIGGAIWAGGLVVLCVAVPLVLQSSYSSTAPSPAEITRQLIRRFSPLAMLGVGLVVGTGLVLSRFYLPNTTALQQTAYGNAVLVKIAGVILAVALAGLHKFVTERHLRTLADVQRFSRTVLIETLIVAGVFLAAAALTSTSPPMSSDEPMHSMDSTHVMFVIDPEFHLWLLRGAAAIAVALAVAFVAGLANEIRSARLPLNHER